MFFSISMKSSLCQCLTPSFSQVSSVHEDEIPSLYLVLVYINFLLMPNFYIDSSNTIYRLFSDATQSINDFQATIKCASYNPLLPETFLPYRLIYI